MKELISLKEQPAVDLLQGSSWLRKTGADWATNGGFIWRTNMHCSCIICVYTVYMFIAIIMSIIIVYPTTSYGCISIIYIYIYYVYIYIMCMYIHARFCILVARRHNTFNGWTNKWPLCVLFPHQLQLLKAIATASLIPHSYISIRKEAGRLQQLWSEKSFSKHRFHIGFSQSFMKCISIFGFWWLRHMPSLPCNL